MSKPQPKAEIALKRMAGSSMLLIWCYSQDAKDWITQHCREFGFLFWDVNLEHFMLHTTPGYDFDEVITYIMSYGNVLVVQ